MIKTQRTSILAIVIQIIAKSLTRYKKDNTKDADKIKLNKMHLFTYFE